MPTGAGLSQVSSEAVLSSASISEDQLFMICEDDCQFIADRAAIDAAVEEFFYNPHLDVLCLAYNAENGFVISQNLMITSDTQTMSCYILKASAIAELLDCITLQRRKPIARGRRV